MFLSKKIGKIKLCPWLHGRPCPCSLKISPLIFYSVEIKCKKLYTPAYWKIINKLQDNGKRDSFIRVIMLLRTKHILSKTSFNQIYFFHNLSMKGQQALLKYDLRSFSVMNKIVFDWFPYLMYQDIHFD